MFLLIQNNIKGTNLLAQNRKVNVLKKKEQQLIDDRTSKKETSLSSYNKKQEK